MTTKVCIVTTVHKVFDNRIFYKEAKSLKSEGYEVTLIAQHNNTESIDGIKIVPITKPGSRIERMTLTALSAFRKALKVNADIYHFHDPELLPIANILTMQGKIVIYDMHEDIVKQIITKEWIMPAFRKPLSAITSVGCRLLLSDTPVIFAEKSYAKDYSWISKSATVLNMPIVINRRELKSSNTINATFTVGYIGAVSETRGSIITIKALNILHQMGLNVQWECVGSICPNNHKKEIISSATPEVLNRIRFYEWMKSEKGLRIMSTCNVGLALLHPIPNYLESYPTKMFEYMMLGLPVIVSNFPLYREIVEKEKCGLVVDPLDAEEIAKAIMWLASNPKEAKEMGLNGQKAVADKYNWKCEEKKLMQFYDGLLYC